MRPFLSRLIFTIRESITDWWLAIESVALKWITKKLPRELPDPADCKHEWNVEEAIVGEVSLGLMCWKCMTSGKIMNPTEQEWADAYHAPSKPYAWTDSSRVVVGPQMSA